MNCLHHFIIKTVSRRIVAGGGFRFQTVTQVTARDKRNRSSDGIGCRPDAAAKLQVVLVGKKTVSEYDYASAPTIAVEEVEWHGTAMIQRIVFEVHHLVVFFSSCSGYRLEEALVRWKLDPRIRRAKVCKITGQFRGVIGDEGAGIERSMR